MGNRSIEGVGTGRPALASGRQVIQGWVLSSALAKQQTGSTKTGTPGPRFDKIVSCAGQIPHTKGIHSKSEGQEDGRPDRCHSYIPSSPPARSLSVILIFYRLLFCFPFSTYFRAPGCRLPQFRISNPESLPPRRATSTVDDVPPISFDNDPLGCCSLCATPENCFIISRADRETLSAVHSAVLCQIRLRNHHQCEKPNAEPSPPQTIVTSNKSPCFCSPGSPRQRFPRDDPEQVRPH